MDNGFVPQCKMSASKLSYSYGHAVFACLFFIPRRVLKFSFTGIAKCSVCMFFFCTLSITTPQDAHKRIVLQVYHGLNTLEFSAVHR